MRVLFQWALLVSSAAALYAQGTQISGRILDPTQAAVSGAAVSLTRVDTGDRRDTTSSSEGYYAFPLLVPGVYELNVQKAGFQSETRKGITVETGQISSIDVSLSVGEISQTVDVDASAPLLKTESAAVAEVVTSADISNMALLDRSTMQLARLNGFVVQANSGANVSFAIAGGRSDNTNYFIDGGNVQNVAMGTPSLAFDPPAESIQEFNVNMSTYAPELGRTSGGVVQMTTKSGTNQFHGSLYEFFRNDALDANDYFALQKPRLRYNLYGASLGGPLKKDKTFFFFNWEETRSTTTVTEAIVAPTLAERVGNFSADLGLFTVTNPRTGVPYADNIIPASQLDPVGLKFAALYPTPNIAGQAYGNVNFVANDPTTVPIDHYVARIDHTFNENNHLYGRFLGETDNYVTASIFPTAGADQYGYTYHDYFYSGSGAWTRNISPTLLNEFRLAFTRRQSLSISAGYGSDINKDVGLTGVNESYAANVIVNGFEPLGNNYQYRAQTPVESHQAVESVTKIKGSHEFKFGGDYRYNKDGDILNSLAGGQLNFTDQATGNSLASLLLGWVNQAEALATYHLHSRVDNYAAYAQDNWKVSPALTLTYGLRWDLDSPRYTTNNYQNAFNPTEINPVSGTPGVITFAGINGQSIYAHNWDFHNFGPRVGFAWKPADKWVIRGGAGILSLGEYDFPAPVILYTGFSTQGTFLSSNNGATPAFILADGFPPLSSPTKADLTPGYGAVPVGQNPNTTVQYFAKNRINGYTYQYSLDIQRELAKNLLLDIQYLGTFGHHLAAPDAQSINQVPTALLGPGDLQSLRPFPQFANVQILGSDVGRSNYNGVNLGLEKRYSHGLLFKFNYTYSKFLDNVAARGELGAPNYEAAFTNYYNQNNDWGLSGNDIRHRIIFSPIYELPFGQGKLFNPSSGFLNRLIGGWSVSAILEWHTGTPLSPFELTNDTNSYSQGVRPNVVGNPNLSGNRSQAQQVAEWFNVDAFAAPAPYTFGDAGRTFGEGPGFFSLDGAILKDISVERFTAQFRLEALNLTNHADFANPNTLQGAGTFGQITSLAPGFGARVVQLGLHVKF